MSLLKRPDFDSTRLLLVDCDERALTSLQKSLDRLGIASSALYGDEPTEFKNVLALIVELDHFASPSLLAQANTCGIAIIVLTQHETLSQIQRALDLGATAMLNKPITQGSVYTTLMMAIGLRARLSGEHERITALQATVDSRAMVAQALAWLMVELDISESQAYERVRSLSMTLNRSLEDICRDLAEGQLSVPKGARS
jgi:AmiR/NasT family two-component response regulator